MLQKQTGSSGALMDQDFQEALLEQVRVCVHLCLWCVTLGALVFGALALCHDKAGGNTGAPACVRPPQCLQCQKMWN